MKLTIERAALLRSLAHVQSVVERRNTIPILSNVLLEAKEERLRLTATDMDLTIHEETEAQIQSPGATTVPAHTFYDIIRKLPDGSEVELSISDGGGQMRLRAGRSNFVLSTLPREDFPAAAASELPYRFTLQAQETRDLIDRTRFAVSTEETRYYLNGIYLHVGAHDSGEVLRAVATDGHRLARVEVALPDGAAGMPGIILPRKMVNELRKLVDDYDEELQVALSEARVCFTFGAIVLSSKLIDGTFPDYERVIPANNDKIMTVDCSLFA